MIKYTEITLDNGYVFIEKIDENGDIFSIPTDLRNSDYQAYLNKDNPEYGKPTQL